MKRPGGGGTRQARATRSPSPGDRMRAVSSSPPTTPRRRPRAPPTPGARPGIRGARALSDDGGRSWHIGFTDGSHDGGDNSNESSAAQLPDGRRYSVHATRAAHAGATASTATRATAARPSTARTRCSTVWTTSRGTGERPSAQRPVGAVALLRALRPTRAGRWRSGAARRRGDLHQGADTVPESAATATSYNCAVARSGSSTRRVRPACTTRSRSGGSRLRPGLTATAGRPPPGTSPPARSPPPTAAPAVRRSRDRRSPPAGAGPP